MRKVILPKGMLQMFKQLGSVIYSKRKTYYYFPHWLCVDEDTGETTLYGLDSLPAEVKEAIASYRETIDADAKR
jgi:hypothetical protein